MMAILTLISQFRQKISLSPALIVTYLLYIFFAVFLLYPLGYMLSRAFFEADRPGITIRYFTIVFTSERYLSAFSNSLNLALVVTVISTLTAIPLAWITVAYKYPGKKILSLGLMLPLILPPFVGALGIRQILGRFGSLNLLLFQLGMIHEPIDWLGAGGPRGVALVQSLHLYPIVYFNLVAALKAIDVTMIEAARITGASGPQILWRIVFPLCLPALLASSIIVFVSSITDLGAPLLFEFRHALPVEIFNLLADVREDPTGYALVTITCLVTMALFFLASSLDGSGAGVLSRTVKRDGDGRTARPIIPRSINRFHSTTLTLSFFAILIFSLLPHIGVFMLAISGRWAMSVLPENLDFSHFYEVFIHPLTSRSTINSLIMAGTSATLDVCIGLTIGYLLIRGTSSGRRLLDLLASLPLAVPGIVLAFGYIGAFSGTLIDNRRNPFPLLIIAYTIRKLPYMVRAVVAGLQGTSVIFEEAGKVFGASSLTVMRRITAPLISGHLFSGFLLCFSFAMIEVSDSLLLAMEEKYYPIAKALYALSARPDGAALACALASLVTLLIAVCLIMSSRLSGKKGGNILS